MKLCTIALILVLIAGALAGCGGRGNGSEASGESASVAQDLESSAEDESYTSDVLVVSYERALPASSQLALGTFQLQGTDNAVTPQQAKALLPLWQAIQGGALQSNAETNAVLKQIEGAMTADQLAAIAAMQLTPEDMGTWMQEQGVQFRPPQGAGGGQGDQGPFANLSEEERASMRATRQAGGGGLGQGGGAGRLADMSEEEREAVRATAEASGVTFGGRGGARGGQIDSMAGPLVELLTELAGQ